MKFSYETDFYGWTEHQASLLRAGRFGEIDREHLIEEIESMGRSERAELENQLAVLLAHLLKWRHQPVLRSRGWQLTIIEQRRQIARLLRRNPSLQYRVAESLEEAYGDALTPYIEIEGRWKVLGIVAGLNVGLYTPNRSAYPYSITPAANPIQERQHNLGLGDRWRPRAARS